MLLSTNISFMIFTLPFSIINTETFDIADEISSITNIFSYSNNSFNFIFYLIFSSEYRKRFKEIYKQTIDCKFFSIILMKFKNRNNDLNRSQNEIELNDRIQNMIDIINASEFNMRISQLEFIDS